MLERWNRQRVIAYLRSEEALRQIRQLLLLWLSGDRGSSHIVNADDSGQDQACPYIELEGFGAARTGRLYCSEIPPTAWISCR